MTLQYKDFETDKTPLTSAALHVFVTNMCVGHIRTQHTPSPGLYYHSFIYVL